MAHIPKFNREQVQEHAFELLQALVGLTNAPVFDIENMETLDPMSKKALIASNTAVLNATQPYLPFDEDVRRPPI